jgi:hypothetical protein
MQTTKQSQSDLTGPSGLTIAQAEANLGLISISKINPTGLVDNDAPGWAAQNCWFSAEACRSAELTWPSETDDEFRL